MIKDFKTNLERTSSAYKNGNLFAHMDEFSFMRFEQDLVIDDPIINSKLAFEVYNTLCGINDFIGVLKKDSMAGFENGYRQWFGSKGAINLASSLICAGANVELYNGGGNSGFCFDGNDSDNLRVNFVSDIGDTFYSRYFGDGVLKLQNKYLDIENDIYKIQLLKKFLKTEEIEGFNGERENSTTFSIDFNKVDRDKLTKNATKALDLLKNNYIHSKPEPNEVLIDANLGALCSRIFNEKSNINQSIIKKEYNYIRGDALLYAKNYLENYAVSAHLKNTENIEIPVMSYFVFERNFDDKFKVQESNKNLFDGMIDLLKSSENQKSLGHFYSELPLVIELAKEGFRMQEMQLGINKSFGGVDLFGTSALDIPGNSKEIKL